MRWSNAATSCGQVCSTCSIGTIRVVDVRGLGLMLAAQFDTAARTSARSSVTVSTDGKLIMMTAGSAGTTMRFMPPLTVTADEIDLALDAFDKALVNAS